MCSNYRPVTRMDCVLSFFGVDIPAHLYERDVFPLGEAPFIRMQQEGGSPAMVAEQGAFGLTRLAWSCARRGARRGSEFIAKGVNLRPHSMFLATSQRLQRLP